MTHSNVDHRTFPGVFSDPYDVSRSFQLSDRLRHNDKFRLIDRIKDADEALKNKQYRTFLRLINSITSFLGRGHRDRIVSRVVYNDIYLKSFEPKTFNMPLSRQEGRFIAASQPSIHLELGINLKTINEHLVRTARKSFHALYGIDLSASSIAIRYSKMLEPVQGASGALRNPSEAMFKDTNANFLHMDEKKGITTILYLSDVTASNGAFRYVEGSHRANISPTLKGLHEFVYNDLQITTYEGVKSFPPEFRAGINYYVWLEPEKQQVIDSFTKTVIGPAGTGITFAGNRLLHGGGIPYASERSALFVQHVGLFLHRLRRVLHPASILQQTFGHVASRSD